MTSLAVVDTARPSEWDGILAFTQDMLKSAQAGDWDAVTRIERERNRRIAKFFAAPPAPHESAWVRRGIEEILASDDRVLALCEAGKGTVTAEIVELRRKSTANRAYERAALA